MAAPLTPPPLTPTRRQLVAVWCIAAVIFGALLVLARATESGLDDPDPARQRHGFLDGGGLPQPASAVTAGLPRPGRRAVVFFVRPDGVSELCRALAGRDLRSLADLVVVVSGEGLCEGIPTVNDPGGGLARAYGLRRPRAGGPPVGYSVVDSRGVIRYRTLDPTVADELGEVHTIVRATP